MKNIDIHSLTIRDLQPSQFYISDEKIENVKKWFNPKDLSNFESIPSDILPPLKEVGASCAMTLMSQA